MQCCLWCLEKCLKFLNKNAYIQTAIFGYNFCVAAKKAFFLIARNIMRVAAVGVVADVVLVLGKVLIPLISAILFYVWADLILADKLHGLVIVTLIVYLMAYFVAKMFVEVSACDPDSEAQRLREAPYVGSLSSGDKHDS